MTGRRLKILVIGSKTAGTHHKSQSTDDRPSLSVLVCKDTSQGKTYHLADAGAIGETCLPSCSDLVSSIRSELTILLGERRKCKEAEDDLEDVSLYSERSNF